METETLFSGDSPIWTELNSPNSNAEDIFSNSSNMAGFTLSPLELEPLVHTPTTLFNPNNNIIINTSNCYKDSSSSQHQLFRNDKNSDPLSPDVLFSYKSSPLQHLQQQQQISQQSQTQQQGQMSPMPYPNPYSQSQQLLSPNGYSPNYCLDQSTFMPTVNGGGGGSGGPTFGAAFPSMSVNVSMNMTMGYLPTDHPATAGFQHQMNWPVAPVSAVSSHSHHGGQSAPSYGTSYSTSSPPSQNYCHQPYSATYSFAADFRPEAADFRTQWIPNTASSLLTTAAGLSSSTNRSFGSSSSKRQKSSRSSENLSPALSSVGGGSKTNLCRICGKTYARPSTLKTHLRTHSGEKPYRCLECHKSFSQAANLTAHVRTHSGEKPFRCPICDRRFSQSSSVTTHMRTHSGERPYRCRLCKKAFSDSSTLTKHLRIHSGEKPYQCKLCLLRFSQSGNLNRHMRVHSTNP